jgi:hypothetical protein
LQFPDVARPVVLLQVSQCIGVNATGGDAVGLGIPPDEKIDERSDVFAPLAEGREVDWNHIETVEKVLAESTGCDQILQIDVGGSDDANIDADGARISDAFEFVLLQNAKKFYLKLIADAVDFVEENSATVGGFEATGAVFDRACEGAFGVTEEFTFKQTFGEGSAVDADEGSGGAWAEFVQGAGR